MKFFLGFLSCDKLKPIRFLIVGGVATAVHIIVAGIIVFCIVNVSPYLANTVAFLFAFLFSYCGHRFYTFSSEGAIWKFFLVSVLGFMVNNIILAGALFFSIADFIAIIFATVSVPIITYTLSSLWVFKNKAL